jgi:elongation factor G
VAPNGKDKGIEIMSDVSTDVLPEDYVASAIDGVRNALEYQKVVDIVVHLIGGSYHQIDSSGIAFKMAGIFAAKNAIKLAELTELK